MDFGIIAISDTHCGSTLGLLAPNTTIPGHPVDGKPSEVTLQPSPYQERLWLIYTRMLEHAKTKLAGLPVFVFINGDIIQGGAFLQDLLTGETSHQIQIARKVFEPLQTIQNLQGIYICHGTPVHSAGDSTAEDILADYLAHDTGRRVTSTRHGLVTIGNNFIVDATHEGPGSGGTYWTGTNTAQNYLRARMIDERLILRRNQVPNLYLRAHVHTAISVSATLPVGDTDITSHLVITPSWQGLGSYGRRRTKGRIYTVNGLYAVECRDSETSAGVTAIHRLTETGDTRERYSSTIDLPATGRGVIAYKYKGTPRPGSGVLAWITRRAKKAKEN